MDTYAQETAAQQRAMDTPQQRRTKSQDEGSSGRSKPRASYACLNCRQRKIKAGLYSRMSAPKKRIANGRSSALLIPYAKSAAHAGHYKFRV